MSENQLSTIGARWIVPVTRPPLRDAAIETAGGRILRLIPGGRSTADEDAGDVALLPGMVNAHVHLEFSHLEAPLGRSGISIAQWIPSVIESRRSVGPGDRREAILRGLRESLEAGTAAIGEIATEPWFLDLETPPGFFVSAFVERICLDPAQIRCRLAELDDWHRNFRNSTTDREASDNLTFGVSPHAPYSLLDEFFEKLIDWSVANRAPVAMHLAESEEELQWSGCGSGPLARFLASVASEVVPPTSRTPRYYLERLAAAPRSLIVHGNYLEPGDLDWVARHRDRMHLVYCPRTHEFFRHAPWPMRAARDRGIEVAIGTDSRASNPDLNLWNELRAIARLHPYLPANEILKMGTMHGARALGVETSLGSIEAGKSALLVRMPIENCNSDPVESLLRDAR